MKSFYCSKIGVLSIVGAIMLSGCSLMTFTEPAPEITDTFWYNDELDQGFTLYANGDFIPLSPNMKSGKWTMEQGKLTVLNNDNSVEVLWSDANVDNNTLKVVNDKQQKTTYTAQKAMDKIENIKWELEYMANAPMSPANDDDIFIQLDPESKRIFGKGGVNNISGAYTIENDKIQLGDKGMFMRTMMAGPNLPFEDVFVKQLGTVNKFIAIDDNLYLYNDNNLLFIFEADKK